MVARGSSSVMAEMTPSLFPSDLYHVPLGLTPIDGLWRDPAAAQIQDWLPNEVSFRVEEGGSYLTMPSCWF